MNKLDFMKATAKDELLEMLKADPSLRWPSKRSISWSISAKQPTVGPGGNV